MRLIDADALEQKLAELAQEPNYQHVWEDWRNGLHMAMEAVSEAPTVESVETVHGKWEVNYDATLGEPIYKCSVCKEEWVTLEGGPAENLWDYCPHCGAKMDSIVEDIEDDDWDSYCADHCYECQGYGDDYRTDEDGELVSACDDCPYNGRDYEDD